tara:strand:+ start:152 stop:565 length:414 start_codon:yes stop_codon:yes gene_type:complete
MKISVERLKEIIKEEIANTPDVLEEDLLPVLPRSALNRRLTYKQLLQPMIEYFEVDDPAIYKLAIRLKHELFNQGRWMNTINYDLMVKYVGGEEPEEPSLEVPIPGEGPEEELPLEPEEELEPAEESWSEEDLELEQ